MVIPKNNTAFLMGNIGFQPEIHIFKHFSATGIPGPDIL
jgi:hypothetical protein